MTDPVGWVAVPRAWLVPGHPYWDRQHQARGRDLIVAWLYLWGRAAWEPTRECGVLLQPGELVVSISDLEADLDLDRSRARRALARFAQGIDGVRLVELARLPEGRHFKIEGYERWAVSRPRGVDDSGADSVAEQGADSVDDQGGDTPNGAAKPSNSESSGAPGSVDDPAADTGIDRAAGTAESRGVDPHRNKAHHGKPSGQPAGLQASVEWLDAIESVWGLELGDDERSLVAGWEAADIDLGWLCDLIRRRAHGGIRTLKWFEPAVADRWVRASAKCDHRPEAVPDPPRGDEPTEWAALRDALEASDAGASPNYLPPVVALSRAGRMVLSVPTAHHQFVLASDWLAKACEVANIDRATVDVETYRETHAQEATK